MGKVECDYIPPEYTEEELAEIAENLERWGMCDEHTRYEEGYTPPPLNEYGYPEEGQS